MRVGFSTYSKGWWIKQVQNDNLWEDMTSIISNEIIISFNLCLWFSKEGRNDIIN